MFNIRFRELVSLPQAFISLKVFWWNKRNGGRLNYLMKSDKFPYSEHLCVIACGSGVKPLNDCRNITEDAGVHESCIDEIRSIKFTGNDVKTSSIDTHIQPA